ncbi:efflux RND transporter permease subunit [Roseiarcaceae bacterium H3SJ34-1]|uniref:efflux RND transporter permease subunit n=1 Tax=Terripilifer ovatus TaxID=3032367 RepID=UPI003AB94C43|nr:efflux RND transporter permease subunit [Roseiarcaceae bacterium H3SJ34-1]
MNISELCIRRPVMTTLLMMSFIVFGIFGYSKLPVAALPRVDFPTVSVSATLPGANPETMASSVAAPLERAFATIPGITQMTSRSSNSQTNITLQFDLDRSIDGAALDVQSQISATLRRLPPELPAPPSFRKVNPADAPIIFMVLKSSVLPLSVTNDYAEFTFAQQISQIPGVAQVLIFGQQKFAVRIEADPDAAAARGLTLNEIRSAVAAANSSAPVGGLRGDTKDAVLKASGQIERAAGYRDIVVAWRNGSPVRLSEIANVTDSVENDRTAAWFGKERGIMLAIFRQSDANTVSVVDAIKEKIPQLEAQLPPSVEARVILDRSTSIRESVHDVQFTLMLSIALVVLVIFLFLKTFAATLIPALALPVSLIGTCAFMYMFGYSIDNISLLAITLAVGFVVDDAIVMLENIMRHIENGMRPFEAALKGSREIGFTILSITLALVAVFIPVLLMGGVVGRVFREFAVVISCSILVSGFVSLTLTPMLCARILKPVDHHAKHGLFIRCVDWFIDGMNSVYRITLDAVLRARLLMLGVTIITIGLSIAMFMWMPKGFFPTEDTGFLSGSTEVSPDTAFPLQSQLNLKVSDILMADPAVDYISSSIGFNGGANQGSIFVALKPKSERGDIQAVIARLRRSTAAVPGINTVFNPVQNFNLSGGRQSRGQYQFTLQSGDLQALYAKGPEMLDRMRNLPGLRDVTSDLQIRNPELNIDIDREKAAAYGLTADQIRQALFNTYGSRQISTIFTQVADYQVILLANRRFQDDPSALGRVYIRAQTGSGGTALASNTTTAGAGSSSASTTAAATAQPVGNVFAAPIIPLDQVATIRRSVGPLTINRQSLQPAVTLSYNVAPGVALSEANEAIRRVAREIQLPATISTNFSGAAALFEEAQRGQVPLIIAAILTIYILLGVLYESYIHPITILSGLPSAGIGALIALQLFGMDLSVIAIIGILLLVGIVKKNAIMMVDFALERRRDGIDALPAIREAALIRFRPIMMTTLAAIFGAVPIAIGAGAGAELRQPLGIAIVGGLCVSQLLTLYITPVIYFYLDKVDSYISGGAAQHEQEAEPDLVPAPQPVRHPAE